MALAEIVHVAIAAPDTLEESLIQKVAAIVNKDLYETRLMLVGKIPKIIVHYNTMQMAEQSAQSLRALGLVAIVCTDSTLRKASQFFRAYTLKLEQKEAVFWDKSGQFIRLDSNNTFLILAGKTQPYSEKEVTKTRTELNLPATVLTGGLPVLRKVKVKTGGTFVQAERFLRLYDRESLNPSVEILQHHFDYSFLEGEMTPSSITNFNTTVEKIRNVFPEAVFDDRLTEPLGVNIPSAKPQDNIEINCRLIYLYHQAISDLPR